MLLSFCNKRLFSSVVVLCVYKLCVQNGIIYDESASLLTAAIQKLVLLHHKNSQQSTV